MIDPSTFPQYDPSVHSLPLSPAARAGDAIHSNYVGRATVKYVYASTFYGSPPMYRGEPDVGPWDGMAYEVIDTEGNRTTLDRSRLGRVTPYTGD